MRPRGLGSGSPAEPRRLNRVRSAAQPLCPLSRSAAHRRALRTPSYCLPRYPTISLSQASASSNNYQMMSAGKLHSLYAAHIISAEVLLTFITRQYRKMCSQYRKVLSLSWRYRSGCCSVRGFEPGALRVNLLIDRCQV